MKSGAVILYAADDPECRGRTYSAGQAFLEKTGDVLVVRNEGKAVAELVATFVVPAGSAERIDEQQPANCPF